MKGKYDKKNPDYIPGPGQYNIDAQKNLHKSPSWRIGTSSRDDALKKALRENYPGPGNYKISSDLKLVSPSYKFGNESRDRKNLNSTPGPGQYYIPYTMMDVPKYLVSGSGFSGQFRYI